jgi:hypothetical protein
MSENVTFTVNGQNGQVYKFSKFDERHAFVFGSPVGDNGVARKGRPSKFPADNVTFNQPMPSVALFVEKPEVKETKVKGDENSSVIPAPTENSNHNETEREKSENFLPLE